MGCLCGSRGPRLPAGSDQQGAIAGDWRAGEETGLSISPSFLPARQPRLQWGGPSSNGKFWKPHLLPLKPQDLNSPPLLRRTAVPRLAPPNLTPCN